MSSNELLDKVSKLQDLMIASATADAEHADPELYIRLRTGLLAEPRVKNDLPSFVKTCRNLDQFWVFISSKFRTYKERKAFIWQAFNPVFEALERPSLSPADESVSEILFNFDAEHVHKVWEKALGRRSDDPEGAITLARTLLETVCKRILDEQGKSHDDDLELPKLFRLTATHLNLAPNQHTEQVFRQILGSCHAVVEGLGAVRNRLSDAHGKGKAPVKPAPRHAQLAVNLAGSVATFLVDTWEARK